MADHFCSKRRNKAVFSVFLVLFFLPFFPAAALAQQDPAEDAENYAEEINRINNEQEELMNAQATLNSLFGKNKTMVIPPQVAGGTLALPSFDSKDLEIEKEAVEENRRLTANG